MVLDKGYVAVLKSFDSSTHGTHKVVVKSPDSSTLWYSSWIGNSAQISQQQQYPMILDTALQLQCSNQPTVVLVVLDKAYVAALKSPDSNTHGTVVPHGTGHSAAGAGDRKQERQVMP